MFHCCSRDEIVRASTELARAFATIGLLRLVNGATPVDMVCTYIIRTKQPWGLRGKACEVNDKHETCEGQMTIRNNRHADALKPFPDGIVRMAKDYLIREFWQHIDHLKNGPVLRTRERWYGTTSGTNNTSCGINRLRVFPKEVLQALRGIRINESSRIWDARHAIGALHSVCTPTMLDDPEWLLSKRYEGRIDESHFDVIRNQEDRAITALLSVLDNYCWQTINRQSIPNDVEKGLLLDLIESLIIMFGPGTFAENYISRQIYEYARLSDTFAVKPDKIFSQCAINRFRDRILSTGNFDWSDGTRMILERLRHLSPEAAMCTGYIPEDDYWDSVLMNNPDVLKRQTPQPHREVAIYLKTELIVQSQKKNYADRIVEAIAKGEFKPDEIGCHYGSRGGDECCCGPEPYCPCEDGTYG